MQAAMRSWRCPGVACTQPIRRCRWFACCRRFFSGTRWDGQRDIDARSGQSVPVLIVGAGPVGLTLLILLSKLGIRSLLVERSSKLSQHPQAHVINNRTMEIFRNMDGLAEEIKALQPPVEHWRRFVYCTTLSGPVLGTVDHLHPSDVGHSRSPENISHFPQHKLLPLLQKRAAALSGGDQGVSSQILMGHECLSVKVTETGVAAAISSVQGGQRAPTYCQAEYLVAADGAGSTIRKLMGINMKGEEELQHLISIHFWSRELGSRLVQTEPGMLYFIFNPHTIAVLVAHDLQSGEFVMQIPIYPPQQSLENFPPEVCKDIIQRAAGISNLNVEVCTVKQWTMHGQVAERFVGGEDRVFLVGDAAHRFPPAGGFGMNTGIQDVHNLGWKLASVLKRNAHPDLLKTYELERRPIALANTALSVANFKAAMAIPTALGLDPSSARLVHTLVGGPTGALLPLDVQRTILNTLFAIGRSQVSTFFLSKYNPLAAARVGQVKKILEEGRSLQLQFPAEDLGFRYTDGALIAETSEEETAYQRQPLGRRVEYVPSTLPGARLPHMDVLVMDDKLAMERKVSTLDLFSTDREEFVLFLGANSSGCKWADAAMESAAKVRLQLKLVFIWPLGTIQRHLGDALQQQELEKSVTGEGNAATLFSENILTASCRQNVPFLHVQEIGKSWWNLCKVSDTGAILVRPDHHIAWRSTQGTTDPARDLDTVFSKILGWSSSQAMANSQEETRSRAVET